MCARSKCEEVSERQSVRKLKRQAMQAHAAAAAAATATATAATLQSAPQPKKDALATVTAQYHLLTIMMAAFLTDLQKTRMYTVMMRTTQPAHVVTLVAILTVSMLLLPQGHAPEATAKGSPLMWLIYLTAFTTHFGAQIWMTFVSGLTLYFALPRHTFGGVQQVLFPKYFTLNTFLSLVTLIVFVKIHPAPLRDAEVLIQVYAMIFCFLLELTIRLCITPPLLHLMAAKNAIEKAFGVGLEVGQYTLGPLALCPHYMKLHRAFRTMHMTVALGNMLTMACTALHLYYLSSKICLV